MCNSGGKRVLFKPLLSVKEGGGGQKAYHKLEALKSLHKKDTLPRVNYKGCLPGHSSRRLVDLKDVFLHIPIHSEYRRFLRLQWEERVYQFCRLPFGLTLSPQVFTDITRPLMEECRLRGIRVIFYLDDILVLADSYRQASAHRDVLLSLLCQAGFRRSPTKCRLTPTQVFPYLGHQENESTPATRQDDSNSFSVQKDVAHKFSPRVRTDGPPGQDELCLNGSTIGTIEL